MVYLVIWTNSNARHETPKIVECENLEAAQAKALEHYKSCLVNASIEWGEIPLTVSDIIAGLGYTAPIKSSYQIYKHRPEF